VIRDGRPHAIDVTIESLPISRPPRRHHVNADDSRLGITFGDLDSEEQGPADGPIVERVDAGSAADMAGLESGDVVRKINQQTIRTAADARRELQRVPVGSTVFLLICRDDAEQVVEIDGE